jgi:uncharacterized OsmC-like protein
VSAIEKQTEAASRVEHAVKRAARYLRVYPEQGWRTAATEATLVDGLRCEIREGDVRIVADLSPKSGGEGAGPNPGTLGRGALAACVAMNLAMRAALLQIPLRAVRVRVEADYDARGEYVPGACEPGYRQVRVAVTVESDAPREAVDQALAEMEATTAFLGTFRRAVDVRLQTTVVASGQEAAA